MSAIVSATRIRRGAWYAMRKDMLVRLVKQCIAHARAQKRWMDRAKGYRDEGKRDNLQGLLELVPDCVQRARAANWALIKSFRAVRNFR